MVVTVTDIRGCTFTKVIWVPQVNYSVTQPTCCEANGLICVSLCPGQHQYTYLWSNGQTTSCLFNVPAGYYCVTITNELGDQFTCCYTLTDAPVQPPSVSFVFNNCGSNVTAEIGPSNCSYTYHWEDFSTNLERGNLSGCDSITFTIVTCNGVYHHGIRVPQLFPSVSQVNCQTGLGSVCIPVNCFRCEPYTYTWSPMPLNSYMNGSCLFAPAGTYTVCITNACGDIVCCQVYIPPSIPPCKLILHLNLFIEGFYIGNGQMRPVLFNTGATTDPTVCDSITVELHEASTPYGLVESAIGI